MRGTCGAGGKGGATGWNDGIGTAPNRGSGITGARGGAGGETGGTTTGVGSGARGLGALIIPVALAGAGAVGGITPGIGMKGGGDTGDGGVGIAGRCAAGVTPGAGGE